LATPNYGYEKRQKELAKKKKKEEKLKLKADRKVDEFGNEESQRPELGLNTENTNPN
tara:strand:+ start:474 stop:644 length:171 start_codon:yes stop_codon:yes gene_type:complete